MARNRSTATISTNHTLQSFRIMRSFPFTFHYYIFHSFLKWSTSSVEHGDTSSVSVQEILFSKSESSWKGAQHPSCLWSATYKANGSLTIVNVVSDRGFLSSPYKYTCKKLIFNYLFIHLPFKTTKDCEKSAAVGISSQHLEDIVRDSDRSLNNLSKIKSGLWVKESFRQQKIIWIQPVLINNRSWTRKIFALMYLNADSPFRNFLDYVSRLQSEFTLNSTYVESKN